MIHNYIGVESNYITQHQFRDGITFIGWSGWPKSFVIEDCICLWRVKR